MRPRRALEVVGTGALLGALAYVVTGVAGAANSLGEDADRLGVGMLRLRYLLFSQVLGPTVGLLLLVAAGAALALRPNRALATSAFSAAVVVSVAVVLAAANDVGLRAPGVAKAGAIVQLLAGLPLSLAAAWLARSAESVADPAGEPPDAGLG